MALTLLATNNAESTLASAISATDTSLIVSAGTGAEFPDAVAGESYFKLTLTDAATGSQVEIVNVTAKAGDIFTIERAQEGTLARAWAANDMVANMMTADTLNVIADFAKQASDSAGEAQGYALSASEFGDNKSTFADTAAGLAATTSGQYFRVPQGTGNVLAFRYYKNNSGVAQEVAEYPGQGSITNTIREFPTLAAAQADADAGNIMVGSTAYYRSPDDSALAIEVINNGGTLEPTGRKMPSQTEVDQVRVQIMTLLNSMFRTSGLPSGWDVLLGINKLGQYAGGIDSTGALNFGKMISVLSEIATANIQNLNAGNIITTGGAKITGVAPDGFDFAFFNKLMQVGVGIKNDGSLAAGKIQAFYADIGRLVSDVIFNGGVKTTGKLPEGFLWGPTDDLGRIPFGLKQNGNLAAGTIEVNRLIAESIESDSLPEEKFPLKTKLADLIHLIIYGQSLSAGVNAAPLQTITAILNAWRYIAGVRAQDGSGTSAEKHASIVAYTETQADTGDGIGYETPMGGAITALLDRMAVNVEGYSPGDVQVLGSAPGQGSRSISELKQPTGTYMTRVVDDMSYGIARANEKGWTYAPHAVIWMQGETDQSAGTSAETYKNSFSEMVDTINGYASTVLGRAIELPWFTYQFNSWKNRTPNTTYPTIPLALLDLARTRDDTRLVQPMYMYDYADNAHLLGFDSKICGYRFGLAIEQELITGTKFEPLWSKDISLQGGVANIWYNPVGKLVLDTSLVTDPGNYGFSVIDPSGNPLTIAEVSVHLDRLRVRASGGIPSGSKLRIGFVGGTTGTLPSRTNGPRCCLRDSQGDKIKYDPDGIAYRMDNYAIVEEITLN
ncbi:sialate O-acetylesterase [Klebsiella pneumoniae]|uniref:sialate O-acetylesterase n=3 Tax=Klebsiella pneumoniae complex TaxID=3390273 RepID=UPI001E36BB68|nr:sialate O-acetylesterase [Klebsiella pneumoniae]